MATKTPRAGRTLLIFAIVVAAMYVLIAATGSAVAGESKWKPRLGLDLEGGTRITLTAAGGTPTQTQLNEARSIIDQRVNGSGVAESEVNTQGGRNIVVEIPGQNARSIVDSISRTAQLRFRLVAAASGAQGSQGQATTPGASPSAGATPSTSPSSAAPSAAPSAVPSSAAPSSGAATPDPRPAPRLDAPAAEPSPSATPSASTGASGSPAASPSASPSSAGRSSDADAPRAQSVTPTLSGAQKTAYEKAIDDPLAWQQSPDQYSQAAFAKFQCPPNGSAGSPIDDKPDAPLVSCDEDGNKFLLSKTVIEGTKISSASYGTPQGGVGWEVRLSFKGDAVKTFATITQALAGNGRQFAAVLDNTVISSPGVNQPILNGDASISGSFSESEARSLSNSLKFGALPIRFDDPSVEQIGASLAGDQLTAGVVAGVVGLLLVMLYCLLYYRGLGTVVIASLIVAAAVTYAAVLLLAKTAGFTLTLPGIAGLIVAVGITADSFIVYFERIRDEMREGRSMRVAVELGWARARNTCLAADAVSLLAAVVLYIFTIGVVKGFAFALGVSTLIDLAVFFWFTKPAMTALAKRTFFNSGHRFSGLSYETLGVDGPPAARGTSARATGGKA
ncbi:hypothetical protein GCM10011519_07080 [Marmoricola endophyticus]|uniref:Protein translocase subunit SecD n=1 Tax=Marmoricola endophyticus TaxID=2040280 RepID=A0A917F0H7_9ACTN|nr:protein translocase subunit SecD [Marmoricola endophyticus]GGF36170.1 hypothetical protein GCM10011519_07080 [Marmoricola endophyticus]